MKKNKKSKKQGRKQKQSNDSCQSLDCLNNLVLSLKLEKDTVRNFLAQEKRVKAKINLLSMSLTTAIKINQLSFRKQTG